jgi:hypothetical protein
VVGREDGIDGACSFVGSAVASQELEQYVVVTLPMELHRPLHYQK